MAKPDCWRNKPGFQLDRRALAGKPNQPQNLKNAQTPLLAQKLWRKNACWQMDKPKTKLCQPTNHAKTETAGKADLLADGRAEKSGGPHAGKATMPKNHFVMTKLRATHPGGQNSLKKLKERKN